jgi:hypothetical protein
VRGQRIAGGRSLRRSLAVASRIADGWGAPYTRGHSISKRAQRRDAGKEEIGAAAHSDELRDADAHVRRPVLDGHCRTGVRIMAHGVPLMMQAAKIRPVEPRVLHHLELIRDIGIEANEIQAARVVRIAGRLAIGSKQPVAVNPSASEDPMHFGPQNCEDPARPRMIIASAIAGEIRKSYDPAG